MHWLTCTESVKCSKMNFLFLAKEKNLEKQRSDFSKVIELPHVLDIKTPTDTSGRDRNN